jgi:hypothetical protein
MATRVTSCSGSSWPLRPPTRPHHGGLADPTCRRRTARHLRRGRHARPMLSLAGQPRRAAGVHARPEGPACRRRPSPRRTCFVAELDRRLAVACTERGRFSQGTTRGDGSTGEDVTSLRTIGGAARLPASGARCPRQSSCRRRVRRSGERQAQAAALLIRATAARVLRQARSRGHGRPCSRPGSTSWSRTRPVDTQSALERLGAGLPWPGTRCGLDIEGVIAFTHGAGPPCCLRDRWRRRQGRPLRPAGPARDGQPRPALGDRVQVPAGAGRVLRRGHRALRRADRDADACGPPDADQGGRLDGRAGDPPQPRRDPAQGHPDRRLGRAPEGRRRHPGGRPADRRAPHRRRA